MHKILTLLTPQSYHQCQECIAKEQSFIFGLRHLDSLRSIVLPQEHIEAITKQLGKVKYMVSDNITIRLHAAPVLNKAADTIPWGVENVGAPALWKRTKGEGVRVAVLDTGISRRHPDLQGQVKGGVSLAGPSAAENGHGTHVAGTIAAVLNNKGIVGVAPGVELYDVHAFTGEGTAEVADIAEGISWAIENKMHIINMSFGTSEDSPLMRQAITQAARAGIVMVASAGNNGGTVEYPAAYRQVIAVGAIDQQGKLAEFSSRGRKVNAFAPGVGINSTWLNRGYRVLDGTSMAAAHVTGLQALKLSSRQRKRA